jgi:hypothetical protein
LHERHIESVLLGRHVSIVATPIGLRCVIEA